MPCRIFICMYHLLCCLACWSICTEGPENEAPHNRTQQNLRSNTCSCHTCRRQRDPPVVTVPPRFNESPRPPVPLARYCPIHGRRGLSDGEAGRGSGFSRTRGSRREDPRRHTLGGNQHLYVSPHHPGQAQQDIEMVHQVFNRY